MVRGGEYGYERVNGAAQRRDPDSFLNWMERAIRARKECAEFGCGECAYWIRKTRGSSPTAASGREAS